MFYMRLSLCNEILNVWYLWKVVQVVLEHIIFYLVVFIYQVPLKMTCQQINGTEWSLCTVVSKRQKPVHSGTRQALNT